MYTSTSKGWCLNPGCLVAPQLPSIWQHLQGPGMHIFYSHLPLLLGQGKNTPIVSLLISSMDDRRSVYLEAIGSSQSLRVDTCLFVRGILQRSEQAPYSLGTFNRICLWPWKRKQRHETVKSSQSLGNDLLTTGGIFHHWARCLFPKYIVNTTLYAHWLKLLLDTIWQRTALSLVWDALLNLL